ncbi:MAG: SUMF1/EgtB/PvdO family nonheme iron enzyme [Acidobacteriota bacterium]
MAPLEASTLREALTLLQVSEGAPPEALDGLPVDLSDTDSADPELRRSQLSSFLLGLVRDELIRLRGLEQFSDQLPAELEALRRDFAEGSARREAWSALYFRFFCPHRPSIDQLVDAAAVSRRTFHRRLNSGLAALAEVLDAGVPEPAPSGEPARGRPALPEALRPVQAHLLEGGPAPEPGALESASRVVPEHLHEHLLVSWARRTLELARQPTPLLDIPVSGPPGSGRRWPTLEETWQGTSDHLLLLGPPGAGKTTALLLLEKLLIEETLTTSEPRLPLSLRLGLEWQPDGGGSSPWESVERRWARQHPRLPSLSELQAHGRIVVLADGLNEIPARDPRLRHEVVDAWSRSFADLSRDGCRVVVTCRELELDRPLRAPDLDFLTAHLNPLPVEAVLSVLRSSLPEALAESWLDQAEVLRQPLLLRLLLTEAEHGAAAASQEALLTSFLRHGLRAELDHEEASIPRNDLLRLHLGRWGTPWELPTSALLTALEGLAWAMQGGDGQALRWSLPFDQTLTALSSDGDGAATKLLDRAVALGILRVDLEANEVGFVHPLFQDYFVARELVRQPRPELVERAWRRDEVEPPLVKALAETPLGEALPPLPVTGWEEATTMAMVMSDEPEADLRELAQGRPAVAGQAAARLRQGGRLDETTAREIAQAVVERTRDREADLRERLDAGRALARLGDPRLSAHQGPHGRYLLREMAEVPGGEVTLGQAEGRTTPETVTVDTFRLGVVPVTTEEWGCFFETGGYENPLFWSGDEARRWQEGIGTGAAHREALFDVNRRYRDEPEHLAEHLRTGYLPAVLLEQVKRRHGLSDDELRAELLEHHPDGPRRQPTYPWGRRGHAEPALLLTFQEARAYCRWLSLQADRRFRLPTEAELWRARQRPLAHPPIDGEPLGNSLPTRLRGFVQVGLFPNSDSVDGVMDLHGNVRVWTTTAWDEDAGRPCTQVELEDPAPLRVMTAWGSAAPFEPPALSFSMRAGVSSFIGLRLVEET